MPSRKSRSRSSRLIPWAMALATGLAFVAGFLQPACATREVASPTCEPVVRVRLGIRPPWILQMSRSWQLDRCPMPAGTFQVMPTPGHLRVQAGAQGEARPFGLGARVETEGEMAVNGRRYRGSLVLRRYSILNEVPLESYLYGVVAREIGGNDLEAQKAQAVVARTYTIAHLGRSEVADDTTFQVYSGVSGETALSVRAVEETRGQVLSYLARLARHVCYHSTCGGHTENNENVFRTSAIPYLRGVSCLLPSAATPAPRPDPAALTPAPGPVPAASPPLPGPEPTPVRDADPAPQASPPAATVSPATAPFGKTPAPPSSALPPGAPECARSSYRSWAVQWPKESFPSLEVVETSPLGRVVQLRVGDRLVAGDEIRRALRFRDASGRWHNLYSTAFSLRKLESGWRAEGGGWGHGVGLCQWGARGMARKGACYADILAHYFPGTVITPLDALTVDRPTRAAQRGHAPR